jgi:dTDP-glucose 4,6-dehydratase
MRILVTGAAGFIGSNFIRYLLRQHPDDIITVLDKMTYAGNMANLADMDGRFRFVPGDIANQSIVEPLVAASEAIVNFAAETHVDRSLMDPGSFITTDVYGTFILLEAARKASIQRYLQVSTDEVYGSVETGSSREEDQLDPRSPYSASKAGGDLMVRAYFSSYGLPACITRGSNTYGPYQYPEKLIPLFVTNAIDDLPLPLYGDGKNVRDWLYVEDHCSAIDKVLRKGAPGEIYNVGGGNERTNLEITECILETLGKPWSLVRPVADRPGHDRRYSLDCSKLSALGWKPFHSFEEALPATVRWYAENGKWWRPLKSGEYLEYYRRNYTGRDSGVVENNL